MDVFDLYRTALDSEIIKRGSEMEYRRGVMINLINAVFDDANRIYAENQDLKHENSILKATVNENRLKEV